jgi:hypothetical protein
MINVKARRKKTIRPIYLTECPTINEFNDATMPKKQNQ